MTIHHKFIKIALISGMIIFFVNLNSFGRINCNGAGGGYDGGGDGEGLIASTNTMETCVIEGAGYYLAANTAFQELLQMVELQDLRGMDTGRLNTLADLAAANMKNAVETYEKLIREAETTPYNHAVQEALKGFPYDAYALANGLNKECFSLVKDFLKKGDITGVLKYTHLSFTRILETVNGIKKGLSRGETPGVPVLRQLNEACAENSLFGSYVSRVFDQIYR